MSLILEALRKSEAERQRGQAPGLFVEQVPATRKRRARKPAWAWGLGVLLAMVVAAWGWREFARGAVDGASPTPSAGPGIAADALPAADSAAPQEDPWSATPPESAANTSPPVERTSPQDVPASTRPAEIAASRLPAEPSGTTQDNAASVPSAVVPSAEPAQAATTTAREPAPAWGAPQSRQIVLPAATGETAPSPAATASTGTPPADVVPLDDPASTTGAAAEEYVPRLAELPASDRAQLPPLKLSMHVYADDPAQRFVILDGKRLQEGASPAAGVVLERIRRDGLVLSVNGRRVLLARP